MRRALATIALAAASLGPALPARADDPVIDCSFNAVQQEDVTAESYEGVAYGYVVHGGPASIRCYLEVDGAEVSTTPTGAGDAVALTAGRVVFAATDTSVVRLCAEGATSHGPFLRCEPTTHTQVPPPYVIYPELSICDLLPQAQGDYVVAAVNGEGDVAVAGEPFWDCPPYSWPPDRT